MATFTETRDNSTVEAVKVAQDAARHFMDESATIGRTYYTSWSAAVQEGMRTAFDLQNSVIQASRTLYDAACQANRNWADQAAESMRKNQAATIKMAAAGLDMVESTMPKPR